MTSKTVVVKQISDKNNLYKFDVGVLANGVPKDSALSRIVLKGVKKRDLIRIVLIIGGTIEEAESGNVVSTIDAKNIIYDNVNKEIIVQFFGKSYKEDVTTEWADICEETFNYKQCDNTFQFPIGISTQSNFHIGVKLKNKYVKPKLICEYVQRNYPYKIRHAYISKMHNNKYVLFEFDMGFVEAVRQRA